MQTTFKSFAALANAIQAEENRRDVAKAAKLRKAANLPAPKVGPRVAR